MLHPGVVAEKRSKPISRSIESSTGCNWAAADDHSSLRWREILPGNQAKEFLVVCVQLRERALQFVSFERHNFETKLLFVAN